MVGGARYTSAWAKAELHDCPWRGRADVVGAPLPEDDPARWVSSNGCRRFSSWISGGAKRRRRNAVGSASESCASGRDVTWTRALRACKTNPAEDASRSFPPEVAVHLVKMACERPEERGIALSQWDCEELARQLIDERVVSSISPDTVRRVLSRHQLKPWRRHSWLSHKVP